MKSILIIDDSDDFRETVMTVLDDAGYDVCEASCPKEALRILEQEDFDLILCDLHMPFSDGPDAAEYITSSEVGLRTIQELAAVFPETPIVAISSTPKQYLRRLAKYLDPVPTFPKPIHSQDVLTLVSSLAEIEHSQEIQ